MDQTEEMMMKNNSSSSSSTSFPEIDSKNVVIMKQVDLKRASPTASWGLIIDKNGLISVPFHMMMTTTPNNTKTSSTHSSSFYEAIVKPTKDLGCSLRLMAIDNKPVKNLQEVKGRFENMTKVRLTVCVVRS